MLNSVLKIFCFLALFLLEAFAQHNGEIIWNKTYGGDSYDEADAVMATYDSAYIIGGYTQSFGLGRFGNAYMVKTNLTGDTIWTRMYGRDGMDVFTSVVVDPDSNYLAVGFTDTQNDYENIYAVKVNEEGSTIWEKNYGGTQKDIGHSIVKASDGGFIIAGETKSFGNGDADVFLMKINNNGDSLWFKTYGTLGNDAAYGINSTDDGGYIVTGLYNSADLWLLRINSAGDTLWTKSIGGTDYEEGINSVETSDKGFITCGSTASIGAGQLDAYLVKTDSIGNVIWQKTYGNTGYDEGRKVLIKPDGGYMIMANTDSQIPGEFNYYIISTNDNGDTLWTHTYGGAGTDRCFDMQLISPDQYLIAGTTYDPVTDGDATLTLIQGEGNPVSVNETLPPSSFHLFNAYPNPFNPSTKIKYTIPELKNGMPVNTKLSIYDILGKQVAVLVNKQQTAGEHEVLFDGENLSSGIYFYKLQFGNLIKTKKMILLK